MPSPDAPSPRHDSTVGFADIKAVPTFSPELLSTEMTVGIGLLACAGLLVLLLKRFRAAPQAPVTLQPTAEELLALRKQRIAKLLAASPIDSRECGAEFSSFLRESLECQYGFPAAKLSSDEFADAFSVSLNTKLRGVPIDQRSELALRARELLRRCERWAFAAPVPSEATSVADSELRSAYTALSELLREAEILRSREEARTRTVVAHPSKPGPSV